MKSGLVFVALGCRYLVMGSNTCEGECLAAEVACEVICGVDVFATAACGIACDAVQISCEDLCNRRRLSDLSMPEFKNSIAAHLLSSGICDDNTVQKHDKRRANLFCDQISNMTTSN